MRLPRLALAAAFIPLAVLMKWDAPVPSVRPELRSAQAGSRPAAPAPRVVPRTVWGADEQLVREEAGYAGKVKAVFIHHTNHPNTYDCGDVPAMLRSLQAEHIMHMGWDDIGYNFVVDRCGNVYQGRAAGAGRSAKGAHTKGFNAHSVGIAALGTFDAGAYVPPPMLEAIAAVAAWKLAPGVDPRGKVRLRSTNGESRFPEGTTANLRVISGHRDGYETRCPGGALYEELPRLRDDVVRRRS